MGGEAEMSIILWILIAYFGINFIMALIAVFQARDYLDDGAMFLLPVFATVFFLGVPMVLVEVFSILREV